MSHNELENGNLAPGVSDLFDRLRQRQSDNNSLQQNASEASDSSEPSTVSDELFRLKSADELNESEAVSVSLEEKAGSENGDVSAEGVPRNNDSLPPEARRALVSLLRQGVILASQKSKLFDLICRYQAAVRSHLADVYLKLVLDDRAGVAFIAGLDESDDGDEEPVSLISRRTLSLYDTLLLLVLRKHYQERESSGEQRIIIDIERIEANLSPFLPLTNSTRSDRKKLSAALRKMVEKHILSSVRGSDDRFEITPIIRYTVNAAFLESMLEEYLRMGQEAGLSMESNGGSGGE